MIQDRGEVIVQDLGSTNGIRINGQRIEKGRLRPGDELSIAHIRYRVEDAGEVHEKTQADSSSNRGSAAEKPSNGNGIHELAPSPPGGVPLPEGEFKHGSKGEPKYGSKGDPKHGSKGEAKLGSKACCEQAVDVLPGVEEGKLVAAVRDKLPEELRDDFRIRVIVERVPNDSPNGSHDSCRPDSSP
jgi:hypothetical protein